MRPEHAFETLERREMLAGNVTIGVQPSLGRLVITGDAADNAVRWEISESGTYVFSGRDGTTINGQSRFELNGGQMSQFNSVRVELGGGRDAFFGVGLVDRPGITSVVFSDSAGNDSAGFLDCNIPGLSIVNDGGDGDDSLSLGNTTLGSLFVFSGGGGDSLYVTGSTINGTFRYDVNNDPIGPVNANDTVWIVDSQFLLQNNTSAFIDTASGNDTVTLTRVTFGTTTGTQGLSLGAGNDTLNAENVTFSGAVTLTDDGGTNAISFRQSFFPSFAVTAAGNTTFDLGDVLIDRNFSYDASAALGNDRVTFDAVGIVGSDASASRILTGGSDDAVDLRALSLGTKIGSFTVDLGTDNDQFRMVNGYLPDANLSIYGNSGDDGVAVDRSSIAALSLDDYAGSNAAVLTATTIRNGLSLNLFTTPVGRQTLWTDQLTVRGAGGALSRLFTGEGADSFRFINSAILGEFELRTFGGNDQVTYEGSTMRSVVFNSNYGDGDDVVTLRNNTYGVSGVFYIHADPGSDTLITQGNTLSPGGVAPEYLNFETTVAS